MAEELEGAWRLLTLTEEEKDGIEGEESGQGQQQVVGVNWLVGKLQISRPFNNFIMVNTFKGIWKLAKEVQISTIEPNFFLFKFASRFDKRRVLDGAPWSFDKHLLLLEEYDGDLRPEDYVFSKATFWIRVFGLPLGLRNQETATRIGNKIGTLVEIDPTLDVGGGGSFIRIRAQIDINKPLRRMVMLTRKGGRHEIWGRLKYERMPTFCYYCGVIGHQDVDCADNADGSETDLASRQYGAWLRASPIRKGSFFGRPNQSYSQKKAGEGTSERTPASSGSSSVRGEKEKRIARTLFDEETGETRPILNKPTRKGVNPTVDNGKEGKDFGLVARKEHGHGGLGQMNEGLSETASCVRDALRNDDLDETLRVIDEQLAKDPNTKVRSPKSTMLSSHMVDVGRKETNKNGDGDLGDPQKKRKTWKRLAREGVSTIVGTASDLGKRNLDSFGRDNDLMEIEGDEKRSRLGSSQHNTLPTAAAGSNQSRRSP